jgi:hypothetical protein
MPGKPKSNIVLQCPHCGARTGIKSGKTQCSQPDHPSMVPVWVISGVALTPKERQEQGI